jgi:hypothetical protein
MPTIPNGMNPTVSSYSMGAPSGVIRTQVAGGMPRYGLDYDRGSQQYKVTLILDKLRLSVWTAFFMQVVKKGAIAFDMPLDSGFGVELHTVNIVPDTYSTARTGDIATVVSFAIDVVSKAYDLSEDDAQGLVDLYNEYGDDTSALLARLAQFANVDTLVLDL